MSFWFPFTGQKGVANKRHNHITLYDQFGRAILISPGVGHVAGLMSRSPVKEKALPRKM